MQNEHSETLEETFAAILLKFDLFNTPESLTLLKMLDVAVPELCKALDASKHDPPA
jgi:hypothetical protein